MTKLYTSNYYQNQKNGSYLSAENTVPVVLDFYQPKNVIDFGCGVGNWLSVFLSNGVSNILGLDGDYVDRSQLRIPENNFKSVDLAGKLDFYGDFDLAMSLEVAEHLPESSAEHFVETLTKHAPVVLFSAAVPFQGGTGHINEQWPDYWVEIFKKFGYVPVDVLRKIIWDNEDVEWWYSQNIMFFVKESRLDDFPKLKDGLSSTYHHQLALLHPRSVSLHYLKFALFPLLKNKISQKFRSFLK